MNWGKEKKGEKMNDLKKKKVEMGGSRNRKKNVKKYE